MNEFYNNDYNFSQYENQYNKYYGNYDKNIKAIGGGGVIIPSNPPNKSKTTGTINNTWNQDQTPVPPLFKSVYYSEPNLTNGYLNENNWVDQSIEQNQISDYYYPSQRFDGITTISNDVINNRNKKTHENTLESKLTLNQFTFPPPLITTKPKVIKPKIKSKHNSNKKKLSQNDLNFVEFIKSNCLYDGKYIYTIENDDDNVKTNNKFNNITHIPYPITLILPKQYYNSLNSNQNHQIEKFASNDDNNNDNNNDNINSNQEINSDGEELNKSKTNLILLVFFSILLIIFFSKHRK